MMNDPIAQIGKRHMAGYIRPCGFYTSDRRRHSLFLGATGTGKSTLLRNLIIQDIEAGRGVGLIDPHGDLADELLDYIPPRRTDDLVYFNPADINYPIGLNLLRSVPKDSRHLVTSGIIQVFKSIWGDSWGPRMEYIFANSIAVLLEAEGQTLLGVQRLLTDHQFRARIVRQVHDPAVRAFWTREFASYSPRFRQEAIAPIQNKIGQLLMSPMMRNILGQVSSKLDARAIMDHGGIFIANLGKGRLGEDKASLLGSLLVTQFQLAAMSRVNVPERDRRDFFLSIDEYHSFTTDSFSGILAEARKYRLALTLSHQYLDQVSEELRNATLANVGTIVAFRVGGRDAKVLEKEFGSTYQARAFSELGNYEICVKTLLGGEPADPFMGKTNAPCGCLYGRRESMIRESRMRYARRRTVVEEKIGRWMR